MQYPQYNPQLAAEPLTDDELFALDEALEELNSDDVMNVEALDGYLTGLLLAPVALSDWPTALWLPLVWGGDGAEPAPFASNRQRKKVTVWVLRHLHHLNSVLHQRPDDWEPVFSIAELEDGEEWVDAQDWCSGFQVALELWRQTVAPQPAWFDAPNLVDWMKPMAQLGADNEESLTAEQYEQLADPEMCDALSRVVPDAVLALLDQRPEQAVRVAQWDDQPRHAGALDD